MFSLVINGNLGSAPEKFTRKHEVSGKNVEGVSFSVAVNRYDRSSKETRTSWFNVVTYGKLADICHEHLDKGSKVTVQAASLWASTSVGNDGEQYNNLNIMAQEVAF